MDNEQTTPSERLITANDLLPELQFSTSRSGGPGGQNVNKVNTKVTLKLDITGSRILSADEKTILTQKAGAKITTEGVLVLSAQEKRSQLENKEAVLQKLEKLLRRAFAKKKPRKKTKPSRSAKEARINEKKKKSEKKKWRQKF